MDTEIRYRTIGVIRTPYSQPEGMPIQPLGAQGSRGTVTVAEEFAGGLKDLEGFSHLILIYHFHLAGGYSLTLTPFLDDTPRGVFATRAPKRPNAIGLSVVKLTGVRENVLQVEDVDIVDGTPLLDIKPYVPEFDVRADAEAGWLARKGEKARRTKSDKRFK